LGKIIISVISDLVTDQRVNRTAHAFHSQGHEVIVIGRKMKKSMSMDPRPYRVVRFSLLFEKGPMFYITYNIRLFFYLLMHEATVYYANDLDTLLPNWLISRMYGSRLIYDSHEYFTGVPELESRPGVQKIWKRLERMMFPSLSYIITVNDSIADLYQQEYHKRVVVVRNVPDVPPGAEVKDSDVFKEANGLPADKRIILLQGSGINIDRGGEEAVQAMEYVDDAVLLIIGSGDVIDTLKEMGAAPHLEGKVIFRDKMPFSKLMQFTAMADIGLTLDKDTNVNYRFSLPNKLFDYIHAGIAVLASNLVEVRNIVEKYQVGCITASHDPKMLATTINEMISDESQLNRWKENARKAAKELTWENEKKKLLHLLHDI